MTRPFARRLAPALALLTLVLIPAAPAEAAGWTCEASALRGTVLGAATIEPLTANKGAAACAPARAGLAGVTAGLPLPLDISALGAETTVVNAGQPVAQQKVGAMGGIADIRVRALPALPIALPQPDLSQIPAVTVPGVGSVDLKPFVQALIKGLPTADILRVQGLVAYANGSCEGNNAQLTGTSSVAGVSVLGVELPVNGPVEKTVSVIDSQDIDPSKVYDAVVATLPPVVQLDPLLTKPIKDALDAIPNIVIPAGLATVKLTPAQQIREGDKLTQRALQVQVSLLGQSLVDLVVGEAVVGSEGVSCATGPASAAESALQCTTRRLVLADVIPGRRVRLLGYADKRYIGRTVNIVYVGSGKRVARAKVRSDGSFKTTATMPPRKQRSSDRARYQAQLGSERSLRLKLQRRMQVFSVRAVKRRVTISGRVVPPLGKPIRKIEVRRRVSCSKWQVVKRITPSRTGRFRTTIAGPPSQLSATYRFATRVRASAKGKSGKTFETFTLPRFVDLG